MERIHGVNLLITRKNYTCPLINRISLFCLMRRQIRKLLYFLDKIYENILQFDLQKKNFVKHTENLPQHPSKKFIGDNLSISS